MSRNCRKHVNTGLRCRKSTSETRFGHSRKEYLFCQDHRWRDSTLFWRMVSYVSEDDFSMRICRGRKSSYTASHHFTVLLIRQAHLRLHDLGVRIVLAELREEFWILRTRQTIERVLHACLPCKIAKNSFGREREAPLPAE
jgi:hypothetical protein